MKARIGSAERSAGTVARWAAWVVVIGCAASAVVFASRFGSDPALSDSPLIGQPVPSIELLELDGTDTVDLASIQADVTVVNFFASWCLQCRSEHAALVATAEAYAGLDVQFVGITFQDRAVDAVDFLAEVGRSPSTLYLYDPASDAAIALGIRGVPETYFIDADGLVQGRIQGETNALLLARTIDAMLAGDTPGTQIVGDVQSNPE